MWINLIQKSTIVPNLRLTIHKNASSKNQAHEQELQEMHTGSRPPFAIHSLMRVHGTTCALVAYFVSLPRVMVVACCLTTRVPQQMVCSGVQDGGLGGSKRFYGAPVQPDIMPNSDAALRVTRNYALLSELKRKGFGFQGSCRSTCSLATKNRKTVNNISYAPIVLANSPSQI